MITLYESFNPRLQKLVFEVIENQIRDGKPPETKATWANTQNPRSFKLANDQHKRRAERASFGRGSQIALIQWRKH